MCNAPCSDLLHDPARAGGGNRWRCSLFAILLALAGMPGCEKHKTAVPPPPEVYYTEAVSKSVAVSSEWIGNTQGLVTAEIRPKVQGYILKQNYQDGAPVRVGEQLYQIDPSQYQASLAQAEGQLAGAQAELERSNINVRIYEPLAKKGAVSQLEYLDAVQKQKGNEAAVAAAKGALQQAKLNLDWTRVTSLIGGVGGISQAKVGDLVSPSSVLTVVATLDPIKVEFPISEQEYLAFSPGAKTAQGGEMSFSQAPPLELTLANGTVHAHLGKLKDVGLGVDPTTGTIKVQGLFPNPGGVLRPGQFVRIRAVTQQLASATLVPQRAIVDVQGQPQVAVVIGTDSFALRHVQTGPLDGANQVILDGVKPGDKVIVDGLARLRPGEKITPKPLSAESKGPVAPKAAAPEK
jgi:membrane fusion protein, multidrug efflux system